MILRETNALAASILLYHVWKVPPRQIKMVEWNWERQSTVHCRWATRPIKPRSHCRLLLRTFRFSPRSPPKIEGLLCSHKAANGPEAIFESSLAMMCSWHQPGPKTPVSILFRIWTEIFLHEWSALWKLFLVKMERDAMTRWVTKQRLDDQWHFDKLPRYVKINFGDWSAGR